MSITFWEDAIDSLRAGQERLVRAIEHTPGTNVTELMTFQWMLISVDNQITRCLQNIDLIERLNNRADAEKARGDRP